MRGRWAERMPLNNFQREVFFPDTLHCRYAYPGLAPWSTLVCLSNDSIQLSYFFCAAGLLRLVSWPMLTRVSHSSNNGFILLFCFDSHSLVFVCTLVSIGLFIKRVDSALLLNAVLLRLVSCPMLTRVLDNVSQEDSSWSVQPSWNTADERGHRRRERK